VKNYYGAGQAGLVKLHIIYAGGLLMAIMAFIPLLFVVLGILIKYFRWYWLISGYNTMSAEKKKNVDARGLGNFMGNCMFAIAGIFLAGIIIDSMGFSWGIMASFLMMSVFIIYILAAAQKYDHNKKTKTDKIILAVVITAVVVITGSLAYGIIFETRPVKVEITADTIGIKGMYGVTVPLSNIKNITLEDGMPKVLAKTNGFNAGDVLKGNFRLEGIGAVKLFVQSRTGPFIYIVTTQGDTVIINYRDGQQTRELYSRLLTASR
jgi:outer membrane lipoprotein SlyB